MSKTIIYEKAVGNLLKCRVYAEKRHDVFIPVIKTYRRTIFHDENFKDAISAINASHELAKDELEMAISKLED